MKLALAGNWIPTRSVDMSGSRGEQPPAHAQDTPDLKVTSPLRTRPKPPSSFIGKLQASLVLPPSALSPPSCNPAVKRWSAPAGSTTQLSPLAPLSPSASLSPCSPVRRFHLGTRPLSPRPGPEAPAGPEVPTGTESLGPETAGRETLPSLNKGRPRHSGKRRLPSRSSLKAAATSVAVEVAMRSNGGESRGQGDDAEKKEEQEEQADDEENEEGERSSPGLREGAEQTSEETATGVECDGGAGGEGGGDEEEKVGEEAGDTGKMGPGVATSGNEEVEEEEEDEVFVLEE
ncbi:bone sialoprotein 2-like [Lethenteron reissneri]|uniref:bone sialoprotein 2-like n=1 Tax=Lethenteron reissneri TaxID=7753 RepID=UPI002AB7F0AA|nr:bone sialoprotein 2-like [Lethenteron reissneri]XP_061432963.1 bone sialoprotein 2-like [Lethenteron reissneri]